MILLLRNRHRFREIGKYDNSLERGIALRNGQKIGCSGIGHVLWNIIVHAVHDDQWRTKHRSELAKQSQCISIGKDCVNRNTG